MSEFNVTLPSITKEFQMEVIFASTDYNSIRLTVEDVARPGLTLSGYFDHFEPRRLQVLGNMEWSYLHKKTPQERLVIFDRLFDYKIPALLICRSLPVDEECLAMAKKHNISILRSSEATSSFCSSLISYLRAELAPMVTRHGVLMEIYGEGVLLTGESGIGKSEAALELLKRGHRLIADDAVEIRRISTNTLAGSAPELIRNYIELRGIGIVNVAKLFGMGSVRSRKAIDLVVNIVPWNNQDAPTARQRWSWRADGWRSNGRPTIIMCTRPAPQPLYLTACGRTDDARRTVSCFGSMRIFRSFPALICSRR